MSIAAFLSGRPRPNPAARTEWRIERRHAEGGAWDRVGGAGTEVSSREELLLAPRFEAGVGDLVRLLDPGGETVGFWVATPDGLVDAGVAPNDYGGRSPDWVAAWEGERAQADEMLRAAVGAVLRRRLLLATADCAALALRRAPTGDARVRDALRAMRLSATGRATAAEVEAARQGLLALERERRGLAVAAEDGRADGGEAAVAHWDAVSAAETLGFACEAALAGSPEEAADRAAATANMALRTERGLRHHAATVRRWLPLSTVLLGIAGGPVPGDDPEGPRP